VGDCLADSSRSCMSIHLTFLEVLTSGTGLEAPDGLGIEFDVIYDGIQT